MAIDSNGFFLPVRKPIAPLFRLLNIDYGDQDVEYVFHYRDKVVFITYSWLLIFSETIFRVDDREHPTEYLIDQQVTKKHGPNLPAELFEKRRNCLWQLCEQTKPVQPGEPTEPSSPGNPSVEPVEASTTPYNETNQNNTLKPCDPLESNQYYWHAYLNVVLLLILWGLFVIFMYRKCRRLSAPNSESNLSSLAPRSQAISSILEKLHFKQRKQPKIKTEYLKQHKRVK